MAYTDRFRPMPNTTSTMTKSTLPTAGNPRATPGTGTPPQQSSPRATPGTGAPPAPTTPAAPAAPTTPPAGTADPSAYLSSIFSAINSAIAGMPGFGATAPGTPPPSGPAPQPGPAQPVAFGPNGQHYNPTTAPFGFDMTMPGVFEQMQQNNQNLWFQTPGTDWAYQQLGQFNDPWGYENWVGENASSMGGPSNTGQYWAGIQGSMNTPTGAEQAVSGGYRGPNNAQTAFDMTKGRVPDSFQPKFDAYYDRMKDKVMSDVNAQGAARGVYGSNSSLNNSIGAGMDVEAQRAKAETDFMLADSQNQMNWLNSLANQGRGADLSGLGIFGANLQGAQYGLDKTKTLGDLAFRADAADLSRDQFEADLRKSADDARASRIGAGVSTGLSADASMQGRYRDAFNFANLAQQAREGRINTLYGQNVQFSNDVMGFIVENYDALLGGDQELSDAQIEAMIAQTADERGWDQQQREVFARDLKGALDAAAAAKKLSG